MVEKDNKDEDLIDEDTVCNLCTSDILNLECVLKIGDNINGNTIGCTISDTFLDKIPVGMQPTGTEGLYDS